MNWTRACYIAVLSMLAVFGMWASFGALADDALVETRYCGVENIQRDADGRIKRRSDVLRAFRVIVPCPETGLTSGACPGWSLDHVWPLARGGCDAVTNIQWLHNSIKSCAASVNPYCKDRWEQRVYPAP